MNAVVSSFTDFPGIIASAALAVSLTAVLIAQGRWRIETDREARQQLGLEPTLVDSFYETDGASQHRVYAFQLTVRNRSDRRNAVAEAELTISRTTPMETEVPAMLPTVRPGETAPVYGEGASIPIPAAFPAHDTISGWLLFRVPRTILKGAKIEGYWISLRNTARDETQLEPIFVREYQDGS